MKKRSRKLISILLTLAMLATLLVPMATPAAASSTYSVNSVQNVTAATTYNDNGTSFNRIVMEVAPGSLTTGQTATIRMALPVDFTSAASLTVPTLSGAGTLNLVAAGPTLTPVGAATVSAAAYNTYREFDITITGANTTDKGLLYVDLSSFRVPSGKTGDIKATFDASPGNPLSSGQVTVAQIGTGVVTLSMQDINTITSAGGTIADIDVKEDRARALLASANTIKLKLPSGFSWTNLGTYTTSTIYGTAAVRPTAALLTADSGRTLLIPSTGGSAAATYYRLAGLGITVDESVAKLGNIEVTVSGDSSISTGTLIVGKYGDFAITTSAFGDPLDVRAGRTDEEIGKIAIEESVAGSLTNGRTITLQLTGGATWFANPTINAANSKNTNALAWSAVGTPPNDTIKATVTASASAAKYVLEKGTINVSAAAGPEIKIIVGGTAGATGEIVVGKTVKVVAVKVDKPTSIVAGAADQVVGDVVIEEAKKEAIAAGTFSPAGTVAGSTNNPTGGLFIEFPTGVFPNLPTVEVIEGDLVIDKQSIARGVTMDGRWVVGVTVKSTSSTPAKVKFSGLKLKVDRDVAEGVIAVAVKGSLNAAAAVFPGYTSVAAGVVATVVTPASTEVKTGAAFVIGSTKYKVGAVEKEMDVAPYVKDGRTFLPVRYVAESLGVASDNILWDEANQTVTLLKGDKVVQVKIGSKAMLVNGTTISMDVAAEITSGRTMLPFRFIAQALGASVTWDGATQTVTLK